MPSSVKWALDLLTGWIVVLMPILQMRTNLSSMHYIPAIIVHVINGFVYVFSIKEAVGF